MVSTTPRLIYHRERNPLHILQEAGLAAEPVWIGSENIAPIGVRSPVAKPIIFQHKSFVVQVRRQLASFKVKCISEIIKLH
jgi:hypothetical protein